MTTVRDIVQAIAALPVTWQAQVVPVRYELDLPVTGDSAELPMRLIPAIAGISLSTARPVTATRGMLARWQITEYLLAREAGMGRGTQDTAADLVDYLDQYTRLLRTLVATSPSLTWEVTDVSGAITVITFAERRYEGVQLTLTVAHMVRET